eukprot:m.39998 g.39998  ORF g.39998 m.39998 type:complete len:79 (-) comp10377_c0_seq1:242-478(-)
MLHLPTQAVKPTIFNSLQPFLPQPTIIMSGGGIYAIAAQAALAGTVFFIYKMGEGSPSKADQEHRKLLKAQKAAAAAQ